MSAPARVVSDDRLVSTVLIEMIEHGMRHMPVVNGRGQILGVLEDSDLLAASTRRGFVLRRAIALSATADDLVRASTGITDLVVDLVRGGTDAIAASGILSVVIDGVARRALELSLGEVEDLPPAGFAWITLGSIARREAMPSSDLDTAMSWPDDARARRGALSGHRPPGARRSWTPARSRRIATVRWPAPADSPGRARPGCARPSSGWLHRWRTRA